jgi:protein O-mannosyl-transferase
LVLLVVVVFGQTAGFDFVNLDDDQYVTTSYETQLGLSPKGIAWAWTHSQIGNWHPITTMSFMLDWQLFGLNPRGYHVHNVVLHAAAVVLLFTLLRRLTNTLWPSALAAALFAIHPLRIESVAWVTERKDVLSGCYFMLTLWAYSLYVRRPSRSRYIAVLVVFTLGLMSKAMLVTLPVVMLLLDYWPLNRFQLSPARLGSGPGAGWWKRAKELMLEKLPLCLVAFGFSVVTAWLSLSSARVMEVLPLRVRLAMAPITTVTYLGKMFCPWNLAPHYPYSLDGPPGWQVLAACALLAAISAWVWRVRPRRPYVLMGWLWYLITLLPVVGLVPGGNQLMADRYTYIPQIGLYVALVWAIGDRWASWPQGWKPATVAGTVVIMATLIALAWWQTSYWRDSETLWRRALACTSQNAVAHEHLGNALRSSAQSAEARQQSALAASLMAQAKQEYQKALAIMPRALPSLSNLGAVLSEEGKLDEAIALFRHALVVNPKVADVYYNLANVLHQKGSTNEAIATYREALKLAPNHLLAHNNLGLLLAATGNLKDAAIQYQQAIESNPAFVHAYNNLANLLAAQGNLDGAEAVYRQVLKFNPPPPAAFRNLADVCRGKGDFGSAIQYYQMALQREARDFMAWNNLGDVLTQQGRFDEALTVFQRGVAAAPQNPVLMYNLAFCLARKGRKEEALTCFQKALGLAEAQKDATTAEAIRGEIKKLGSDTPHL